MEEIKADKKLTVLEGAMPFKLCSVDEYKNSVYAELGNSRVDDMVCLLRTGNIIKTVIGKDTWEKDKKKKLPRKTREHYTSAYAVVEGMVLSLLEDVRREYIFTMQKQKEDEMKDIEKNVIIPATNLTKV